MEHYDRYLSCMTEHDAEEIKQTCARDVPIPAFLSKMGFANAFQELHTPIFLRFGKARYNTTTLYTF